MNPFVMEVTCSVCGGPGCARPRDAAAEWFGAEIRHQDPAVCAMYLERKKRKLEEKEKELKEMSDGINPVPI